jgi:hypothetical protein
VRILIYAAIASIILFAVIGLVYGTKFGHIYIMRPINDKLYHEANEIAPPAGSDPSKIKPIVLHLVFAARDIQPGVITPDDVEQRDVEMRQSFNPPTEKHRYFYYCDEIVGQQTDEVIPKDTCLERPQ